MKTKLTNNTLKHAQKWFKIHHIPTLIYNNTIYYNEGSFELELSKDEILYRAKEYTRLKTNNLIKEL
jgi:hypothetical protein